jgi:hypothetical protein
MNLKKIPLNYRVEDGIQSLEELWKSIKLLAEGRVVDNERENYYPINVRNLQLETLKSLVRALEHTHECLTGKVNTEDIQETYNGMDKFEAAVEKMVDTYGIGEERSEDIKEFLLGTYHAMDIGELYAKYMKGGEYQ